MLLGLAGEPQVGKDTIYHLIKEQFEPEARVIRDAFGDRMKHAAYRCFKPDATLEEAYEFFEWMKLHGRVECVDVRTGDIRRDTSGRDFIRHFGTEAARDIIGEDVWVDLVLPDWRDDDYGRKDGTSRDDLLIITDPRLPNEAERILDCGGSIWEVTRNGSQGSEHISDKRLSEYITLTIENNSTIDALAAKVNAAVWGEIGLQHAAN